MVFGVLGLSIVLLGYVYLIIRMRWRLTRLVSLVVNLQARVKSALQVAKDRLSTVSASNPALRKRLNPVERFYLILRRSQSNYWTSRCSA